jgi:hypothetical protein
MKGQSATRGMFNAPPRPAVVTRELTYHRGITPQPAIRWFRCA